MDKIQRGGLTILIMGVVALLFCVGWAVWRTSEHDAFVGISWKIVFFTPHAIALGILALIYGERLDPMVGPLKSEERKRKVWAFIIVCSIPGIALCWWLHDVVASRGYHM